MNARELNGMLRFVGGRPMLILRDHEAGRIKVFQGNVWIMTVIPGHLLGTGTECVLLGREDAGFYDEERTTWGGAAYALSELQQTGVVPCMDADGFPACWED